MNITKVTDQFSVSSQVELADISMLADKGYRLLICNRPDNEAPNQPRFADLEKEAAKAGLEFIYLPVIPGKIQDEHVDEFQSIIEKVAKPVHAFCRTGTRSITLWAHYQRRQGISSESILGILNDCGYDLKNIF